MAENKTKPTPINPADFVENIDMPQRKQDALELLELMQKVTHEEPTMWGESMVGFGTYHYRYASGREGDYFIVGFSPRKANTTIYLLNGVEQYPELLNKLGPHKTGKSCLYLKKLDEVDKEVLKSLIRQSYQDLKQKYAT